MITLKRFAMGVLLLVLAVSARADDANTTSVSDGVTVLQSVFTAILVPSVLVLVTRIAKRYLRRGTNC